MIQIPRLILAACVIGLAFTGSPAKAAVQVNAIEILIDTLPGDLFRRDLKRIRRTNLPTRSVEHDDATIVRENQVGRHFGIWSKGDVEFSHRVDWVAEDWDGKCSITDARLVLGAWGADGNNDIVEVEGVDLGSLVSDQSWWEGFTRTVFTDLGTAVDMAFQSDGIVNVTVHKNEDAQSHWAKYDHLSVFASALKFSYECSPHATPEPTTLVVWTGLICAASVVFSRRRG